MAGAVLDLRDGPATRSARHYGFELSLIFSPLFLWFSV
jgi:hypothetical protein